MFLITSLRADIANTIAKVIASRPDMKEFYKPHVVAGVALICAILPFDLFQLVFMLIGALCYSVIRMPMPHTKLGVKKVPGVAKANAPAHIRGLAAPPPWRTAQRLGGPRVRRGMTEQSPSATKIAGKTPTAMPIAPVVFMSEGLEGEVAELLDKLAPKPESAELVQQVAATINASIRHLFPGVEVVGFASTDFRSSSAFGVAAPDVEVVIKVNSDVLTGRCWPRDGGHYATDMHKLQKSAIRSITERLVSDSGFKFRRSAFRGSEPRVTLLAPRCDGADGAFPVEISINSTTPFRNMALVKECKHLDTRIEGLFMLVRRWSKDRAICHVPKGHLPRYQWNLLVAYFMQVAGFGDGALLPPLDRFSSTPAHVLACAADGTAEGDKTSVAELFKAFLRFYTEDFKWGQEVVSVRSGKRASRRTIGSASSISIEDPFNGSLDLGDCLTPSSFKRLQEELERAKAFCARNASLGDILELWAPDDEAAATAVGGNQPEEGDE